MSYCQIIGQTVFFSLSNAASCIEQVLDVASLKAAAVRM